MSGHSRKTRQLIWTHHRASVRPKTQLPVQSGFFFLFKQDAFRNTENKNISYVLIPQWPNSANSNRVHLQNSGDLFLHSNWFRWEISVYLVWGFFLVWFGFFQLEEYQHLLKEFNRQKSLAYPQFGPGIHVARVIYANWDNLYFFQIILWLDFHTLSKLYFLKTI